MTHRHESATNLEADCAAVVDEAIRCGQIRRTSREKFMALARKNLPSVKASLAIVPKRSTASVEFTEDEQHLATQLRAGGLTEAKVEAAIEAQRARKVV